MERVTATRYVAPLREGGSLPGLMEADDDGTYVVKFRGAGQGPRALIAEVISAGIASALGLPVPRLVEIEVDGAMALGEPDEEIQDLLRASDGLNLGVDFLPGALDLDPVAFEVERDFAARVLWFDALIGNVDRSHRNPNLLHWQGPYLIDHGAALTFHHRWSDAPSYDARLYDADDHVLVTLAPDVTAIDVSLAALLPLDAIDAIVAEVPDAWLADEVDFEDGDAVRIAYRDRIAGRLSSREAWLPALAATAQARGGSRLPRRNQRPDWLESGEVSRGR